MYLRGMGTLLLSCRKVNASPDCVWPDDLLWNLYLLKGVIFDLVLLLRR